jgi:hypothetical protein
LFGSKNEGCATRRLAALEITRKKTWIAKVRGRLSEKTGKTGVKTSLSAL